MPVVGNSLAIKSIVNTHKNLTNSAYNYSSPYFFVVGAGISAGHIKTTSQIIEQFKTENDIKNICPEYNDNWETSNKYAYLFEKIYPEPIQRRDFLVELMKNAQINDSNLLLASLLGNHRQNFKPFADTVITTNFDDLLERSLSILCKEYLLVDQPSEVQKVFMAQKDVIKLVHVHGSYRYYDSCNLKFEIENRAYHNSNMLSMYAYISSLLTNKVPIILGYSGWKDVVTKAIIDRINSPIPCHYYWFCYKIKDLINILNYQPIINNENINFVVSDNIFSSLNLDLTSPIQVSQFLDLHNNNPELIKEADILTSDLILTDLNNQIFNDSNKAKTVIDGTYEIVSNFIKFHYGDEKLNQFKQSTNPINKSTIETSNKENPSFDIEISEIRKFYLSNNYDKVISLIANKYDDLSKLAREYSFNLLIELIEAKSYYKGIGTEIKNYHKIIKIINEEYAEKNKTSIDKLRPFYYITEKINYSNHRHIVGAKYKLIGLIKNEIGKIPLIDLSEENLYFYIYIYYNYLHYLTELPDPKINPLLEYENFFKEFESSKNKELIYYYIIKAKFDLGLYYQHNKNYIESNKLFHLIVKIKNNSHLMSEYGEELLEVIAYSEFYLNYNDFLTYDLTNDSNRKELIKRFEKFIKREDYSEINLQELNRTSFNLLNKIKELN